MIDNVNYITAFTLFNSNSGAMLSIKKARRLHSCALYLKYL